MVQHSLIPDPPGSGADRAGQIGLDYSAGDGATPATAQHVVPAPVPDG